jgi:hypothetical protein
LIEEGREGIVKENGGKEGEREDGERELDRRRERE